MLFLHLYTKVRCFDHQSLGHFFAFDCFVGFEFFFYFPNASFKDLWKGGLHKVKSNLSSGFIIPTKIFFGFFDVLFYFVFFNISFDFMIFSTEFIDSISISEPTKFQS